MKKIRFLFLLFISIHGLGQNHLIGVQGGLNLTDLTAKNVFDDTNMRPGFIGGITYELKIADDYRIGIDALYAQQGFIDNMIYTDEYGNETGGNTKFKFNYDYFSLSLKIGYAMGDKTKIIPRIGLVPSVLIQAKMIVPRFDDSGNVIGHEKYDAGDVVSKFDLGGLLELGFERAVSDKLLLCPSLTYKHSITAFSNSDYFDGSKMRHYGFSIAVGLKFSMDPNSLREKQKVH